jgi:hypothetical protein
MNKKAMTSYLAVGKCTFVSDRGRWTKTAATAAHTSAATAVQQVLSEWRVSLAAKYCFELHKWLLLLHVFEKKD